MVKLYVEGGGDSKSLKIECRQGFRKFLEKAGFKGKMPGISACGTRRLAYEDYCLAVAHGQAALLLVDSEAPVFGVHQPGDPAGWQPWRHLQQRQDDGWNKPQGAADSDCHLMVQCMESWYPAERDTLKSFFGKGFRETRLPPLAKPIENITTTDALDSLKKATRDCKTKSGYDKGEHSFKLLARIDPTKVTAASPWAMRFVDELKRKALFEIE